MRFFLILLILSFSMKTIAQSYFLEKCQETINNEELSNDDHYKIQFSWLKIRFNTSNCSDLVRNIQKLNSTNQLAPSYQYDTGNLEEITPFKPIQLKWTPLHQLVTEAEWDKFRVAFKSFYLFKEFKNLLHLNHVSEISAEDGTICQALNDLPWITSISLRHAISDPIQWKLKPIEIECLRKRKIDIFITGPFTPDRISDQLVNQIIGIENYLGDIQQLHLYKKLNYLGLIDYKGNSRLKVLTGIRSLRHLHINLAQIRDPEDVRFLTHLRFLSINCFNSSNNCENQALENVDFLSDLKLLKGLDLSKNKIQNIGALAQLKKLEFLNLRMNQITSIQELKALNKLKFLDISSNLIRSIHSLQTTGDLRFLNISDNEITDFSVLKLISKLKYLSAGRNSYLIDQFSIPKSVKVLNLSGNNHSNRHFFIANLKHSITPEFEDTDEQHWTKLALFDLTQNENNLLATQSNNLAQKLDTSDLKNIEFLSLNHSFLHSYEFLKKLKNLRYLDVSSNKIQDQNFFRHLTKSIEYLQVRDNAIKDLDDLKSYARLRFLDISDNDLADADLDIRSPRLSDLIIDRCKLQSLPELSFSPNIERLSLAYNYLKTFSNPILHKLKQIFLEHNNFDNIPHFNGNSYLNLISLRFNKIQDIDHLKHPSRDELNPTAISSSARIWLDLGHNLINNLSTVNDNNFEIILDSNPIDRSSYKMCPQDSPNKSIASFCSST